MMHQISIILLITITIAQNVYADLMSAPTSIAGAQKPPVETQIVPSVISTNPGVALTPQNFGFEYHMASDADHLMVENQILSLQINMLEQLPRHDIYGLLSPLLRLNKKHLKTLAHKSTIKKAEGTFTIGDLTLILGKEYLTHNKQDLLLERGEWDKVNREFRCSYRLPGNDQIGKIIVLKLSNIMIKNPGTPVAQFLNSVIEFPEGMSVIQPKPVIVVEERPRLTYW